MLPPLTHPSSHPSPVPVSPLLLLHPSPYFVYFFSFFFSPLTLALFLSLSVLVLSLSLSQPPILLRCLLPSVSILQHHHLASPEGRPVSLAPASHPPPLSSPLSLFLSLSSCWLFLTLSHCVAPSLGLSSLLRICVSEAAPGRFWGGLLCWINMAPAAGREEFC